MPKNMRFHGVFSRQGNDQVFFVLAFVLGTSGILLAKWYGLSIFFVALIPATILIFYAFSAWYFHRFHLEPDMIGDNCYYLGFIFTLVSLSWTLYAVATMQESDNNAVVLQIISGFGVALTSTIFGIFFRAFFIQLRPDPVSSERKARKDILDAARELRTELSQSVKEFKGFMIEVQQQTNEHQAKLNTATEQALEAHQTWMKRYARDTAQVVAEIHRESIKKVIENMDEGGKNAVKVIQEKSDSAAQLILDRINELNKRLENAALEIDKKSHAVSTSVTVLGDRIAVAANSLQIAVAGAADRVRTSGESVSDSAKDFGEHFASAANSFQVAVVEVTDQMNASGKSVSESTKIFDNEVKEYITTMQQRRIGLQSALDGVSRTVESRVTKASEQIEQMGSLIDKRFTELEKRFEQTTDSTKLASEEMTKSAQIIAEVSIILEEMRHKISAFEQLPDKEDAKIIANELTNAVIAVKNIAAEIERFYKITTAYQVEVENSNATDSSIILDSKNINVSEETRRRFGIFTRDKQ